LSANSGQSVREAGCKPFAKKRHCRFLTVTKEAPAGAFFFCADGKGILAFLSLTLYNYHIKLGK
jgi:hypothetical protein